MAVLVTGATGALGETVVDRLLAEGREVRVLTRRPFRAHALFGERVGVHEWHPLSEPVPTEALAAVTGVIHMMGAPLAGAPARGRSELAQVSRQKSLRALHQAIAGRGVRLVTTSVAVTSAADGGPVDEPLSDATPGHPSGALQPSLPWEMDALDAPADASVAIVRLGLLAAPDSAPIAALAGIASLGLKPDLEGCLIPAIAPVDAAAALAGLLDRPDLVGIFHGMAPEPVRGEALAAALAAARLGVALPVGLPRWLLARRLGLLADIVTSKRPLAPARLLAAGARFEVADPAAALIEAIAAAASRRRGPSRPPGGAGERPATPASAAARQDA